MIMNDHNEALSLLSRESSSSSFSVMPTGTARRAQQDADDLGQTGSQASGNSTAKIVCGVNVGLVVLGVICETGTLSSE